MADSALPDHVRRNRGRWNAEAPNYAAAGEGAWAREEPTWGVWRVPESQLRVLPANLAGKAGIELGCGTAYISAWLARRGVKVVGLDASPAQLATVRRLQREHGLEFPLIEADAERVPCRARAFDLAVSECGACLWADPDRWVAEAARILRPGGELIFLVNSPLFVLCVPQRMAWPPSDCCGRLSTCAGSSGPATRESSFTWRTETGSAYCEGTVSSSRT